MSSADRRAPAPPDASLYRSLVESVKDYALVTLDLDGRITSWNPGARRIKGYEAEEVLGRHFRIFYPPETREADPEAQLERATREGRSETEGWRVRKDGTRFWAHVVVTALYRDDTLIGFGKVTADRTEEREAKRGLSRRERQLEEAQAIAHLGSWEYVFETGEINWSPELFRIFGLEPGDTLSYERYLGLLHPEDRERVRRKVRQAVDTGASYLHEHRIRRPSGEVRWVQSRGTVAEEDGSKRLIGTTLDITEMKESQEHARSLAGEQVAREEAERTAQRMGFLAEASALLGTSLDYTDTLQTVAWLAVPSFADLAAVDMREPDDGVRRLAVAHLDPDRLELARRLHDRYPEPPDGEHGARAVIRSGEPELLEHIPPELLEDMAQDEEHHGMLKELELRSAIVVPIRVRDRILGAITFVYTESEREYSQEDLVIAQELANRAGLAVENAQLHDAERAAREHAERANERTRRLQMITAELSEAVTPEAVAGVMVEHGSAALGAASGALVLQRPDRSLEMVRSVGVPEPVRAQYERFDLDAGLPLAAAIRTGEIVVVPDVASREARFPDLSPIREKTGTSAMVAVPLRSGTGVIGSLGFGYREPRPFDRADQEFLKALGRQCAQALERAWLYETEHVAREAAEEASRAKSQFVAMVSHELRTPLSAIIGYQELLSEGIPGSVNDKQKEQLGRIRSAATHLRDLINQILSLSRIEAGKEDVEWSSVDVGTLSREVAELMRPKATARDLELVTRLDEIDARVVTDPGKVRQVLLNLVSNAIKFTPSGSVTLGARAGGDPDTVEIYVTDTGVGIGEEDRERIFDAFTQVDQSMTRSVGGSGLGLAVSRRLAGLLGGHLDLESEVGHGSTFVLRLPRTRPDTPPAG